MSLLRNRLLPLLIALVLALGPLIVCVTLLCVVFAEVLWRSAPVN